jgi:proteic killer suppression protein
MIGSFRCRETSGQFETGRSQRFGSIATVATRKLAMLQAAETVGFLCTPPANRLATLSGDRGGQSASGSTTSTASAFANANLNCLRH